MREALGRRLDLLSPEANELLTLAAVMGRDFSFDLLKTVGEHEDDDALVKLVEEGIRGRVIEERERAGTYRFTHAMMQETLLSELSTTRRVRLHGRIGEAMEAIFGPERSERRAAEMAHHYVESATLTKDHAAKGARYSQLAGEQAEAATAPVEAARHYQECLALVDEAEDGLGVDQAALLTSLGRCLRLAGEYREAWRSLMRAVRMHHERQDPVGMARTTLEALTIQAPLDRHVALAEEALGFLGDADPYLEARLLVARGVPMMLYSVDPQPLRRAAELAEAHGFEDVRVAALMGQARHTFIDGGEIERAITLQREAVDLADRLGIPHGFGRMRSESLLWLAIAGRLDETQASAEAELAVARRAHVQWDENGYRVVLGGIHLARCDFQQFESQIGEVPGAQVPQMWDLDLRRAAMAGDTPRVMELLPATNLENHDAPYVRGGRARALLNTGDRNGAQTEFDAWVEVFKLLPEGPGHIAQIAIIDECLPALGDDAPVAEAYEEASARSHWRFAALQGRNLDHIRGALALRLGRIGEAEEWYRTGLEWSERERCPVEQGRCLQGLAEVAEQRGSVRRPRRCSTGPGPCSRSTARSSTSIRCWPRRTS